MHRSVADRFGVAKCTAWSCVFRVCNSLVRRVNEFIKWPQGEEYIDNSEKFEFISEIPRVVGCLDGSAINIIAPKENVYY